MEREHVKQLSTYMAYITSLCAFELDLCLIIVLCSTSDNIISPVQLDMELI